MKSVNLSEVNGYLPAMTSGYQAGWTTVSLYEKGTTIPEAEALKLLGAAIEHHEQMEKAIANLRSLLGMRG